MAAKIIRNAAVVQQLIQAEKQSKYLWGNPLVTVESPSQNQQWIPSQRASNGENVSMV